MNGLAHALGRAVRHGDLESVQRLLSQGASPDGLLSGKPSWCAQTPLQVAAGCKSSPPEVLSLLLQKTRNVDQRCSESDNTAFLLAAQANDIAKLTLLKDAGAEIHFVNQHGYGAACFASCAGASMLLAAMEMLLDWGVSPDPESKYGESALSVCSRRGRFDVVSLLLDRGANPAPLGWTPLHHAAAFGQLRTEEDFIRHPGNVADRDRWERTPLHVAVAANDICAIQILLAAGADPHVTWRCQQTTLQLAAATNAVEAIALLLDAGLDVDEGCEGFDDTPLMKALEHDSLQAAELLLKRGARHEGHHASKKQPVHFCHSEPTFRLLLEAGADLNVVDNAGEWPLKTVAATGDAPLTEFLLNHGANPKLTSTGETALHGAVGSDSIKTVEALLKAGAEVNAQDVDGWTPLYHVDSPEMAALLIDHGANPTVGSSWDSPLDWIKDPDARAVLQQVLEMRQS